MPAHNHFVSASAADGNTGSPAGSKVALGVGVNMYTATPNPLAQMNPNALAPAGGDQPHNNMQPFLTLNFCIALQGVYPPRT
jgi:microcystin-dependent protein